MPYKPKLNKNIFRVFIGLHGTEEIEDDIEMMKYNVLASDASNAINKVKREYELDQEMFISRVEYLGPLDIR